MRIRRPAEAQIEGPTTELPAAAAGVAGETRRAVAQAYSQPSAVSRVVALRAGERVARVQQHTHDDEQPSSHGASLRRILPGRPQAVFKRGLDPSAPSLGPFTYGHRRSEEHTSELQSRG